MRSIRIKGRVIALLSMIVGVIWLTAFILLTQCGIDSWEVGVLEVVSLGMVATVGWCQWMSISIVEHYAKRSKCRKGSK